MGPLLVYWSVANVSVKGSFSVSVSVGVSVSAGIRING